MTRLWLLPRGYQIGGFHWGCISLFVLLVFIGCREPPRSRYIHIAGRTLYRPFSYEKHSRSKYLDQLGQHHFHNRTLDSNG